MSSFCRMRKLLKQSIYQDALVILMKQWKAFIYSDVAKWKQRTCSLNHTSRRSWYLSFFALPWSRGGQWFNSGSIEVLRLEPWLYFWSQHCPNLSFNFFCHRVIYSTCFFIFPNITWKWFMTGRCSVARLTLAFLYHHELGFIPQSFIDLLHFITF